MLYQIKQKKDQYVIAMLDLGHEKIHWHKEKERGKLGDEPH